MVKPLRTMKYGEILLMISEIYKEGETGTLLCQNGPVAKYLYFQEGQLIFAASNSLEDKFTQILLEQGKLKEEQLDMAMEKKGSKTIAKTLTELGFISSSDLIDSLIKQVERIAESLLKWESGSGSFKVEALPAGVAKLPISTQRFILDLALKIDNRHFIMQILGGIDKVFTIHKAEKDVVLNLPLTKDEVELVKLCDGIKSIEQIASLSKQDVFSVAKFFVGLHYLGFCRPKKEVTTIEGISGEEAHKEEEKKVDLSFLNEMLPSVIPESEVKKEEQKEEDKPFEVLLPKPDVKFTPVTIGEEKEEQPTQKFAKEKEKKEPQKPSLFEPSFLPPEEEKKTEEKVFEEPKVSIPPLPLKEKRERKNFLKVAVIPLSVVAILLVTLFFVYFFFIREGQKDQPILQPTPKSFPKATKTETGENKKVELMPNIEEQKVVKPNAPKPQEKQEKDVTFNVEPKKEEPKEVKEAQKVKQKEENSKEERNIDVYSSLAKGDYKSAAEAFKAIYSKKKGGFTVVIMLACESESITKALSEFKNPNEMIILPYNYKGRSCFRVLYGHFKTKEEAEKAFESIPESFKVAGAKVFPFEKMMQ